MKDFDIIIDWECFGNTVSDDVETNVLRILSIYSYHLLQKQITHEEIEYKFEIIRLQKYILEID